LKLGRYLLLRFPRFFSFGVFSHAGPNESQLAETSFNFHIRGVGYAKGGNSASKIFGGESKPPPPDMELVVNVSGPEPGYVATPTFLLAAAFTCLQDVSVVGVLTPAVAFRGTGLRKRLEDAGISFRTQPPRAC
jgi:hypothetical protein